MSALEYPGKPLPRRFFTRRADAVARDLLGRVLVHDGPGGRAAGRIVETEAYLPRGAPASHAHGGPTDRNASMFLRGGHAYVYLIYGMHLCFNVVSGPAGSGQAVLLRALEPVEGVELMEKRRKSAILCNGPAKLAQAMALGMGLDGVDLLAGTPAICVGRPASPGSIGRGPRIGISRAADLPLRFFVQDSAFLSR